MLVVFEAAAPALIIGLLYLARSVTGGDWLVAGLGLWLVIVAAVSGYAGPRTVWAINALAVGLASCWWRPLSRGCAGHER